MPSSTVSRRQASRSRAKPAVPAGVRDPDVAQIVVGLARINDPMFTYLIAMMVDRVSELLNAARKAKR